MSGQLMCLETKYTSVTRACISDQNITYPRRLPSVFFLSLLPLRVITIPTSHTLLVEQFYMPLNIYK